MKKNLVNKLFIDEVKRKRHIILFSFLIILISILSIYSIYKHITSNITEHITYKENSSINYKVYLKENQFFEKEYAELTKLIKKLEKILAHEKELLKVVKY